MNVDVAVISDTGRVRDANEDSFLVDNELFIFAVADGMGGHAAGEIASATAVETVRAAVASGIGIEQAISDANDAVLIKSSSDESLSGMGTTFTAIGFSSDKKLVVAHVGDSRAYVLHRQMLDASSDTSTELVRITKDHSLVEELVDAGQITEEEANVHPRRSVITRALGIDKNVDVDIIDIPFLKGDRYLLCSDGLTSMVRDEDIIKVLKSEPTPNECATALVSKANQAGGADNITVLVIDVVNPEIVTPDIKPVAKSIPAKDPEISKLQKKGKIGFGFRVFVGIAVVIALLAGVYVFTKSYAQKGFYLDEKNNQVVLMRGQYGGVLIWDPQLDTQTGIEIKNLSGADKLIVARHENYNSRKLALERIEQMRRRQKNQDSLKITSSTTTTTIPGQTTVPVTVPPATSVSSGE